MMLAIAFAPLAAICLVLWLVPELLSFAAGVMLVVTLAALAGWAMLLWPRRRPTREGRS